MRTGWVCRWDQVRRLLSLLRGNDSDHRDRDHRAVQILTISWEVNLSLSLSLSGRHDWHSVVAVNHSTSARRYQTREVNGFEFDELNVIVELDIGFEEIRLISSYFQCNIQRIQS